MQRNKWFGTILVLALFVMFLGGCIPQAQKFAVIASGAPAVGPQQGKVFTLALRSAVRGQPISIAMPEEAARSLDLVNQDSGLGLYFFIYGGEQPSAGYSVQIRSIVYTYGDGRGKYTVRWMLQGPAKVQAAAAVLTHPYILVRITNRSVPIENVVFEQVK